MATPCTESLGCESGGTSMEEMRGVGFAESAPPFRDRERAAVDIDVCPACPSSKIFKNDDDDDEACRFPVRV